MTRQTYSIDFVTRGYEADPSRRVPLPMMLQYLEQLRWHSIVDPASGLGPYVDRGFFFVVRCQEMVVHRAVGQDTRLRAYMWPHGFGRSRITLGHELRRVDDGAPIARARVVGLWLGPNRRLARIPDDLRAFAATLARPRPAELAPAVGVGEGLLESSYIRPPDLVFPHRDLDIAPPTDPPVGELPEGEVFEYRCHVRPSDLDIFAHVNAATYLRYFDDARAAADGLVGRQLRRPLLRCAIHHERETVEGEEVRIRVWRSELGGDTLAFWLTAGDEESLRCRATVELAPATLGT